MKGFPLVLLGAVVWLLASQASAHPGGTDASGCHTCRTNCSRWGLSSGEYHCHGGGSSSGSSSARRPRRTEPPPPPPPSPPPVRIYRDDELSSEAEAPVNSIVVRTDRPPPRGVVGVTVLAAVDGDTLVAREGEVLYLLKLRDVEAPELEQPYGKKARQRLATQVEGRRILVWPEKGEGCLIPVRAEVDGQDVAEQMLLEGAVWAAPAAPAAWRRVEALARREAAGLWGGSLPEAPWEFRARRRMARKSAHP